MAKLRVSCWTRNSGTITVPIPANSIKSNKQDWLKWFAEQQVQEQLGVKIHPLHVEVMYD